MPAKRPKINITTDKGTEEILKTLAVREGVPVAKKANDLLKEALEIEEDRAFGALANKRLKKKNLQWVSHKDAWRGFI